MKGLIYKDFCVIMHSMKRVLIIAPILLFLVMAAMAFAGVTNQPPAYMLPVVLCMAIGLGTVFSTYGFDEKSGWMRQAFISPVQRLAYYHAKLAINLIYVSGTAVIGIAVAVLSMLLFGGCSAESFAFVFGAAGGMFLLSMILSICCNALIIRLGVQKAFVIFMLIIVIGNMFNAGTVVGALILDPELLSDYIITLCLVLFGVLIIGVTVLLYFLGRRWIMRKEV